MKSGGIPQEKLTRDNIRRDLRRKLWKSCLLLAVAVLAMAALVYLIVSDPLFIFQRNEYGRFPHLPGWVYVILMPVVLGFAVWETWLVICGFRHRLYIAKDVLVSSEEDNSVNLHHYRAHSICTLHFSGYGDYKVPEKNYPWSKEYPMSPEGVYHTSFDGDEFYLVLSRPHSGKILLAYPTKYFTLEE
jgi:hypothetical protein